MADGAVLEVTRETLVRILQEYANLLENSSSEVETLEKDLRLLRAKLKDDSTITHTHRETMRELERQMITTVYQIEDAIDYFEAQTSKHRSVIMRCVKSPLETLDVAKQVHDITKAVVRLQNLRGYSGESKVESEEVMKYGGVSIDNDMVGFQDEKRKIIHRLTEDTGELDIISIFGMPGLGKTTLAYKIFTDRTIKSTFGPSRRIWVDIPHEYQKKAENRDRVLLSILSHFIKDMQNKQCMSYLNKFQLVQEKLRRSDRFLIVMDDVCSMEAWNDLRGIFPKNKKGGKILITTQLEEVAFNSNFRVPSRLLTHEESWDLLRREALSYMNSECPAVLEQHGKRIAENCDGHPLLIMNIGKILKKKFLAGNLGGMFYTPRTWEEVSASLSSSLDEEFQNTYNSRFYYRLPYHLRPCFLYLGMFPKGSDISVRMLTRLWIAEGFIHTRERESLEDTAFEYLTELIDWSLVKAEKRSYDGHRIKTCSVHYMLREFCRKEASIKGQNIFQEMKYNTEKNKFEPSIISELKQYRRLCIDSDVNKFFSSNPSCPLVHSLVCFSKDNLESTSISSISKLLKYLRVLEAELLTFKNLPKSWNKLALLKCVVLSINSKVIPKVISKLRNMQTLIIYTTFPELEIKANIWKMSKLRHVETDKPTKLPNPKGSVEDSQLQTLGMMSHRSCTKDVFGRLGSLQKLVIHGQLETLMRATGLDKLDKLEKLKLVNDLSGGVLQQRQNLCQLPPTLRRLTLYATNLDWNYMSTL